MNIEAALKAKPAGRARWKLFTDGGLRLRLSGTRTAPRSAASRPCFMPGWAIWMAGGRLWERLQQFEHGAGRKLVAGRPRQDEVS